VASATLLTACGGGSTAAGSSPAAKSTGNGIEKLAAADIMTKMDAAASAATSVHVVGKASQVSLDLTIGKDGADDTVGVGGPPVEVLRVGTDYYMKGDAAFWTKTANAQVAKVVAGKYVKVTAAQAADYQSFTNMSDFFTGMLKAGGTVTKGAVTTVDGQRALTLTDTSDGSLLFVALDGPPLPLKSSKSGSDGGSVTFSAWNQPVTVSAPAAADVIDMAALAAGTTG
jgi:hypothetical protein